MRLSQFMMQSCDFKQFINRQLIICYSFLYFHTCSYWTLCGQQSYVHVTILDTYLHSKTILFEQHIFLRAWLPSRGTLTEIHQQGHPSWEGRTLRGAVQGQWGHGAALGDDPDRQWAEQGPPSWAATRDSHCLGM